MLLRLIWKTNERIIKAEIQYSITVVFYNELLWSLNYPRIKNTSKVLPEKIGAVSFEVCGYIQYLLT
jgi:hypothetical protein